MSLRGRITINGSVLGVLILAVTFVVGITRVIRNDARVDEDETTVIRFCHWQLELGYRDAIAAVIAEYERIQREQFHRNVKVIQIPIGGSFYAQWVNIHLIAGDAPDIVEMASSKLTREDTYVARFFVPMGDRIHRPNPYHTGTPLAGVPWRETFIDGMRNGYYENLQEYYAAPLTAITIRLFYNKALLRAATGSDRPCRTMGELLGACRKIRAYGEKNGRKLLPISGSGFSAGVFVARYAVAFTAPLESVLDVDLDGVISRREVYLGFLRGQVDFRHPNIAAYYECLKALCDEFGEGFMALGREQATFQFVQGKAALIMTGSWDAQSMFAGAQGKFDVGVMDFPLPAPGERWGEFIAGREAELGFGHGAKYAVNKRSRHQDQAFDFLMFITSVKYNEMLNQKAGWCPGTIAARASEWMREFEPNPEGFISSVGFGYGSYVDTALSGQQWRYLQGEISYDEFASQVEAALRDPVNGGDLAWGLEYDSAARECRNQETVLTIQRLRALLDPAAVDAAEKYRKALLRQVAGNNGEAVRALYEQVRKQSIPMP